MSERTSESAAGHKPELVVIGPPGAGKTTVGTAVARALDVPFRDTDADIEAATGKPIAEIFIDDGEEHFRALEREAVSVALAEHGGVLALGGGAILDEGTRALLRRHRVVYLAVGHADAAQRVGLNRDRPLLLGNPRARLRALLEARRPFYEQAATFTVDTGGRSTDEVTDLVVQELQARVAR